MLLLTISFKPLLSQEKQFHQVPYKTEEYDSLSTEVVDLSGRQNTGNIISINKSDSTFSIPEDFDGLSEIKSSKCTHHYINAVRCSLAGYS